MLCGKSTRESDRWQDKNSRMIRKERGKVNTANQHALCGKSTREFDRWQDKDSRMKRKQRDKVNIANHHASQRTWIRVTLEPTAGQLKHCSVKRKWLLALEEFLSKQTLYMHYLISWKLICVYVSIRVSHEHLGFVDPNQNMIVVSWQNEQMKKKDTTTEQIK